MNSLSIPRLVCVARVATRLSYGILLTTLLVGGIKSGTASVLVIIAVAPLALFAPGILRDNPRTLVLLCFVALIYFTAIVANLFEPDRTFYDAIAVVAVSVLFIAAMLLSRWVQRRAPDTATPTTNPGVAGREGQTDE